MSNYDILADIREKANNELQEMKSVLSDLPASEVNKSILADILHDGFEIRKKYEKEIPLDLLMNLIMLEEFFTGDFIQ